MSDFNVTKGSFEGPFVISKMVPKSQEHGNSEHTSRSRKKHGSRTLGSLGCECRRDFSNNLLLK